MQCTCKVGCLCRYLCFLKESVKHYEEGQDHTTHNRVVVGIRAKLNTIHEMPKGKTSCCSVAAGCLALFATPPIREIILSPLSISFRQSGRCFTVYFSLSHLLDMLSSEVITAVTSGSYDHYRVIMYSGLRRMKLKTISSELGSLKTSPPCTGSHFKWRNLH